MYLNPVSDNGQIKQLRHTPKPIEGPIHLFVVDDDERDQFFAKYTLSQSERVDNVSCVNSADALFQLLREKGYYEDSHKTQAVILFDINLRGESGIDGLKKIKLHPLTEDIPVIMLTGDLSGERVFEAYQMNAQGFLMKPLKVEHFHSIIDQGWAWPSDI